MWKDCNVVMIPTNKRAEIGDLAIINGILKQTFSNCIKQELQHLYVISDKKIKEGDWVIWNKQVFQVNTQKAYSNTPYITLAYAAKYDWVKKIIATTDNSLKLPSIPQQFIRYFIEEYNKGNVIDKVQVEYDLEAAIYNKTTEFCLKINPDNTINIKQIKDSWSRQEVKCLLLKLIKDCNENDYLLHHYDGEYRDLTDWIEENL